MVAGYARVIAKSQARDGNSLEEQKRTLIDSGADQDNIYVDMFTGIKLDRPEFD